MYKWIVNKSEYWTNQNIKNSVLEIVWKLLCKFHPSLLLFCWINLWGRDISLTLLVDGAVVQILADLQVAQKKLQNLAKQDPGRARQKS